MWVLVNAREPALHYFLLCDHPYTVGRKDCDLLFSSDKSVSRVHASFTVTPVAKEAIRNVNARSALTVIDKRSSFGTHVNGERLAPEVSRDLAEGDKVSFGGADSVVQVTWVPYVFCCSGIPPGRVAALEAKIATFDGRLSDQWTDACTHLVMIELNVTQKNILALIGNKPTVMPQWIDEALARNNATTWPDVDSFLPPLRMSIKLPPSVSFLPDPRRKTVFSGLVFHFVSVEQMRNNEPQIVAGGGRVVLVDGTFSVAEAKALSAGDRLRLIKHHTKYTLACAPEVYEVLERGLECRGHRLLREDEIGWAVLFGSTAEKCNPQSRGRDAESYRGETQSQHPNAPNHNNAVPRRPAVSMSQTLAPHGSHEDGHAGVSGMKQKGKAQSSTSGVGSSAAADFQTVQLPPANFLSRDNSTPIAVGPPAGRSIDGDVPMAVDAAPAPPLQPANIAHEDQRCDRNRLPTRNADLAVADAAAVKDVTRENKRPSDEVDEADEMNRKRIRLGKQPDTQPIAVSVTATVADEGVVPMDTTTHMYGGSDEIESGPLDAEGKAAASVGLQAANAGPSVNGGARDHAGDPAPRQYFEPATPSLVSVSFVSLIRPAVAQAVNVGANSSSNVKKFKKAYYVGLGSTHNPLPLDRPVVEARPRAEPREMRWANEEPKPKATQAPMLQAPAQAPAQAAIQSMPPVQSAPAAVEPSGPSTAAAVNASQAAPTAAIAKRVAVQSQLRFRANAQSQASAAGDAASTQRGDRAPELGAALFGNDARQRLRRTRN